MPIYAIDDREPEIHPEAYVHPDAVVIGAVVLGPRSTVWPTAVLRGDFGVIRIGAETSVQDGTVIHATAEDDTVVGVWCTVGHNAHLEGCVIEDGCLIGSMSTVLNRAFVGAGSLVAAGAVVRPGTIMPPRSMAAGVPATIREGVVEVEFDGPVAKYQKAWEMYRRSLRRIDA